MPDIAGQIDAEGLALSLEVRDPEVVAELSAFTDPDDRRRVALTALRIGVLALRQARGEMDAEVVRREGRRILDEMERELLAHQETVAATLSNTLKEYFDPASGRFSERVERLVRRDGELEQVLRSQLQGEDSALGKTLDSFVGQRSEIMRVLSPSESEGLLKSIHDTLDGELTLQRERVLREFDLNTPESALSRLVRDLSERNGNLEQALSEQIDSVVGEFSLDNENSALARLVKQVERAQQQITREFSLDDETSSLTRMRRELLGVLEQQQQSNQAFQEEVKAALSAMAARREEELRSTRHGAAFEDEVFAFVEREARGSNDVPEHTGDRAGSIRNCKVGDCVVELGPDHVASGARVVFEAKEDRSYNLTKVLEEIETARKNRRASVGVFVCSSLTAGADVPLFARYGRDVVVTWDSEEPATDAFLSAAIMVARALASSDVSAEAEHAFELEQIERSVNEIEKRAQSLDDIRVYTETIQSSATKILDRVRISREKLLAEVSKIRTLTTELGDGDAEVGVNP